MPSIKAREARLRRRLARRGERLWIPRGNAAYEYGPYAVVDISRNTIESWGCTLEGIEGWFAEEPHAA